MRTLLRILVTFVSAVAAYYFTYWFGGGLGVLVAGAVAFSAGFFGPIIFMPSANQGPLLGIFITGPLGLVLGAVAGAIHWFVRKQRRTGDDAAS